MPPPAARPRGALRHAALVLLGLSAFYSLFFAPVLFGGRLLGAVEDGCLYHYPALLGGRALWDPLLLGGYPRFADPQLMLWYPLALPGSHHGASAASAAVMRCQSYSAAVGSGWRIAASPALCVRR